MEFLSYKLVYVPVYMNSIVALLQCWLATLQAYSAKPLTSEVYDLTQLA